MAPRPTKSTQSKFIWTERDCGSMHGACTGLHQILCVCILASGLVVFNRDSQVCLSLLERKRNKELHACIIELDLEVFGK